MEKDFDSGNCIWNHICYKNNKLTNYVHLKRENPLLVLKSNIDPAIFSVLSSSNNFYNEIIASKSPGYISLFGITSFFEQGTEIWFGFYWSVVVIV